MSRSGYEQNLIWQCRVAQLPPVTPEYRFHPVRKWKIDLAFVPQRLAVEVEGAVFAGGRHTRGAGFEQDCIKYAELAILGWRLLRVTPRHVKNGIALGWIERALGAEKDAHVSIGEYSGPVQEGHPEASRERRRRTTARGRGDVGDRAVPAPTRP